MNLYAAAMTNLCTSSVYRPSVIISLRLLAVVEVHGCVNYLCLHSTTGEGYVKKN